MLDMKEGHILTGTIDDWKSGGNELKLWTYGGGS